MVPATESAKQACYTLRLGLNDLEARAEGAPGDGGTVFDLSEWTQEVASLVVEVVGAYGDCCARVLAGFVLSLLHAHGCDHIGNFPDFVKEEWPSNTQCSGPFWPVYRKMLINGNSYKVVNVAEWMCVHPGRTLEDYDHYRVSCREDSSSFWRNF